jgi:hypothetical protein
MTIGEVALLRAQGGDVPGALKLHEEKLQLGRQLGDIDLIASAQYDLAMLDLNQERPTEALERLAESWDINLRFGRADGVAVVGQLYGQLLAAADRSRALEVLRTSREAFRLLKRTAKVNELDELIQRLERPEPSPEQPRPTLWQRLKRKLLG